MAEGAPVTVVGLADDRFEVLSPEARRAMVSAAAVAGSRRQLRLWRSWPATSRSDAETLEIGDDSAAVGAAVRRWTDQGMPVCVLASGDPGFFGIVRALLGVVDRHALAVLPAPSSVSVAFARLALPWDDAVVVSTHGRPLDDAVTVARTARKVAVLASRETPPEALGAALVEAGTSMDLVAVCERLGSADESVQELTLSQLASGQFDPVAVVVLVGPGGLPLVGWGPGTKQSPGTGQTPGTGQGPGNGQALGTGQTPAWGAPEARVADGEGARAQAEMRAVVLGKLSLPPDGVLWDVGAGSGGVAIECALMRPGLTVLAVEARPETAARISANALTFGAAVHVVPGRAPEALDPLPSPDRAFVGGGGLAVLDAVLERLRPGGRVVGAFAALDEAAGAAARLGNLVQLSVSRGERLADGAWRLAAQDGPAFVAWGPS